MLNIMRVKNLILTLLASMLIAGCATNATMTDDERTIAYEQFIVTEKLESIKRITSFRFYSWTPLGDQHLIISSRMNRPHLITLQRRCFDLSFNHAIIVHSDGSTLSAKFDSVSVLEPIPIKCFIKSIYPLNKEQAKAIKKIGYADEETSKNNWSIKTIANKTNSNHIVGNRGFIIHHRLIILG